MIYFYRTLFLMGFSSQALFAGGCVSTPLTPGQLRTVHQRKQVKTMGKVAVTLDRMARQRCDDAVRNAPARRAENADAHLQKAKEYVQAAGELRAAMYPISEEAAQL